MNLLSSHILTSIIFLPLVGALILTVLPSRWKVEIRIVSLVISVLLVFASGVLFWIIDPSGEFDFVERVSWMPSLGINYHLGVDGMSLLMMLLVSFLLLISILVSWREIDKRIKEFHILLLVLASGMLGVFASLDVFLFYVFWEFVLIPMYFIIGIWGGEGRVQAATKFIIYTVLGSLLMLVAMIYAAAKTGSFDLLSWYSHKFTVFEQLWLFAAIGIAFAIKIPLVPLCSWLPDSHSEAPTAGSILLAGVLLKMGSYGFFRIAMPTFPLAVAKFSSFIIILALIGIVAGSLIAMVQSNLKRLIAYSSIPHMGFIILGLFAIDRDAAGGAMLQMANHGITTCALFALVGMIYARKRTMVIDEMGGEARRMPILASIFILMTLSAIGLPGLNNFAGEFLILLGAFQTKTIFASIALIGVILVAVYMLWLIQRVFFGKQRNAETERVRGIDFRECMILIPLIALVILIGLRPQFILSRLWKPAKAFVELTKRVEMIIPASEYEKDR